MNQTPVTGKQNTTRAIANIFKDNEHLLRCAETLKGKRKAKSASCKQVKTSTRSHHFFCFLSHRGDAQDAVQGSIHIWKNLEKTDKTMQMHLRVLNDQVYSCTQRIMKQFKRG